MNKHPNPLIYLKGFKSKELLSLIDFMYHGEADVYQNDLDEFLSKAKELQLRGLTKDKEENKEEDNKLKVIPRKQAITSDIKADNLKHQETEVETKFDSKKYVLNETTTVMTISSSPSQMSFSGGSSEDLKATLWSMISQNGNTFTCTVCGKTKDKDTDKQANVQMERHVESLHVDGISYDCARCDKTFRSKNTLHKHTYLKHK